MNTNEARGQQRRLFEGHKETEFPGGGHGQEGQLLYAGPGR